MGLVGPAATRNVGEIAESLLVAVIVPTIAQLPL